MCVNNLPGVAIIKSCSISSHFSFKFCQSSYLSEPSVNAQCFAWNKTRNGIRSDRCDDFDCFVAEVGPRYLSKRTLDVIDRRHETSVVDRSKIAVKVTSNVSVKTDPHSVIVHEKLAVPRHRTVRSVAVTQMVAATTFYTARCRRFRGAKERRV